MKILLKTELPVLKFQIRKKETDFEQEERTESKGVMDDVSD